MSDFEGRRRAAGAAGHPGQVPRRPLRRRLGRLQPDPHRPGVRHEGRPARRDPPRPLVDGPGGARQPADAGGDPRALKRLSVQFRGMGFPEQEIVVTSTVKERDGGHSDAPTRSPSRAATRSSATPMRSSSCLTQATSRVAARCAPRITRAHRAPAADPSPGRRLHLGIRRARRLEVDRRNRRGRVGAVDGTLRARRARACGLPDPPAHIRRPRSDRRGLPALRRRAPGVGADGRGRDRPRPLAHASRGRGGHARDDLDAVAGQRPPGASLRRRPRAPPGSTESRSCACSRRS